MNQTKNNKQQITKRDSKRKSLLSVICYLLSGNSGQIVLILVLITVVGLMIGLSLITRTITDVRISSQIEQSSRAFSAAEAGIESALKGAAVGSPVGSVSLPGASAQYSVSSLGGGTSPFTFPLTEVGLTQTVWLIPHNSDGMSLNEDGPWSNPSDQPYQTSSSLNICFGPSTTGNPAIVISLIYKESGSYKIAKGAYDSTARGNNFLLADTVGGYCGGNFSFKKTIVPTIDLNVGVSARLLLLRITPLYENTPLSIMPSGSDPLPLQGKTITSVGQTTTGVVRKMRVNQGYPILPSLLDFALFSEN